MREKTLNLLGLMRKANAIAVGETNTGGAVRAGKAKLLLLAADALRQEPGAIVFRMGGDEFLLLREVQEAQEAGAIRKTLKQNFRQKGISVALGAITLPTPIEDIDAAIAEVDRLMYEDKTRHYRSRHELRE